MTDEDGFLSDLMSRPWSPDAKHGFRPAGLFVGKGANALEVVVAHSSSRPTRAALLESWNVRRGGRAAPVLLVVLHPGGAALCGASGEAPPVYPKIDPGQVERLCQEVLDQPDRHPPRRRKSSTPTWHPSGACCAPSSGPGCGAPSRTWPGSCST